MAKPLPSNQKNQLVKLKESASFLCIVYFVPALSPFLYKGGSEAPDGNLPGMSCLTNVWTELIAPGELLL
ncbi:hypothetical protein AGMMS50248_02450 [Deltaproteobacteria bacterium]|nr:hypothetical protein AGMMS50248_02450 [Deltaproteobacteria bacterium]